jgi:hypothetical protein
MAACLLSITVVLPEWVMRPPPSVCSPVAAWPLEVDMRGELAPFEHNLRLSRFTNGHTFTGRRTSAPTDKSLYISSNWI